MKWLKKIVLVEVETCFNNNNLEAFVRRELTDRQVKVVQVHSQVIQESEQKRNSPTFPL